MADSASQHARAGPSRAASEASPPPSAAPSPRVVVLAALPAREEHTAELLRTIHVALVCRQPRQRRCAVALHGHDVEAGRRLEAARRQRQGLPRVASPGVERAEHAVGDQGVLAAAPGAMSARTAHRLGPSPKLAQDAGHAARAHLLQAALAERSHRPIAVPSASRAPHVVPGDLVGRPQPLVHLRGLTVSSCSSASESPARSSRRRRRTRRPSPAPRPPGPIARA